MNSLNPDVYRQRLAARIAEERTKRAARSASSATTVGLRTAADSDEAAENAAALDAFLDDLSGGLGLNRRSAPAEDPFWREPDHNAVLPFPQAETASQAQTAASDPEALDALASALEAACDLDALPGAGPGLVWALRRAGVRSLSDLATLEIEDLTARMGPVGRLAPLPRWVGVARAQNPGFSPPV